MDKTPNLEMPYIMAAQAQKHITHNEALRTLDIVTQLTVIDRDLTAPPGTPTDGDCYIVAASATGDWSGKEGLVAAFQDNAWIFYPPVKGWRCWVFDESTLLVWDGAAWGEVSTGGGAGGSVNPTPLVGVNATADTANRLIVSSPNSLFNHEGASHRVKVNKASDSDTASFLFQDGFSGRAEIGLTGDDDFHFKVSADGAAWKDSMIINQATGVVDFPYTPFSSGSGAFNYLINGDFAINQRGFAGGALSSGDYGHDRWKAGSAGANYSVSGGVVALNSGSLAQIIEAPRLETSQITVSVGDLSNGDLSVTIAGIAATITAGSGRRGTTLTLPSAATGNITIEFAPASGAVSFEQVQLELGNVASPFSYRPAALESTLCGRYFQKSAGEWLVGQFMSSGSILALRYPVFLRPVMRANPSVIIANGNSDTEWLGTSKNVIRNGTGDFVIEISGPSTGNARPSFTWTAEAEL